MSAEDVFIRKLTMLDIIKLNKMYNSLSEKQILLPSWYLRHRIRRYPLVSRSSSVSILYAENFKGAVKDCS